MNTRSKTMQSTTDGSRFQALVLVSLALLVATLVATLASAGLSPQVVA